MAVGSGRVTVAAIDRFMNRVMQAWAIATIAIFYSTLLLALAACDDNADHDPATWRQFDADVRELHQGMCNGRQGDLRGGLADGTCPE